MQKGAAELSLPILSAALVAGPSFCLKVSALTLLTVGPLEGGGLKPMPLRLQQLFGES